jgi:hypothetical protein
MSTQPRPESEPSRGQQLAGLLSTTFPAPNIKTFAFEEGTVYVVAKQIFDGSPSVFDYRPGVLWVYDFSPNLPKTGISWRPFYTGDEALARHELTVIGADKARRAYDEALADYRKPANW